MANPVDLSGSVRFDLHSGTVRLFDDEKGVVVPASVLAALVKSAPADARAQVARDFGAHLGRGAAKRGSILEAGLEEAATALAAQLALAGLGTCNLERWGRALVVHVTESPIEDASFVANVIEGALSAAAARSVSCTVLTGDNGIRVLVASERGTLRVRGWIEQGTSWSDALVRLQSGGS
ncbi:MAG TPA: hypothetical protein VH054_12045 [Polyangiaceae bacterium]|jgi:hypothetical protein|nr:hypothetical protein [Polyangiaceae bacterium]